jgi:hypothetical protein
VSTDEKLDTISRQLDQLLTLTEILVGLQAGVPLEQTLAAQKAERDKVYGYLHPNRRNLVVPQPKTAKEIRMEMRAISTAMAMADK